MALGFQGGAWQSPGFQQQTVVVARGAGSVGRGGKRKKYLLDKGEVSLNREELEQALESLLVSPPEVEREADTPAPKIKPQDRAIVAAFPAYPDLRDLLLAQQQIEAAQVLRAVAQRMADEQDERDVEELILWQ